MDFNKNYTEKTLLVISGLCTVIVVLASLPSFYGISIFSMIGGPLMLLVGVAMCIFFVALLVIPFVIAYKLHKKDRSVGAISMSIVSILICVPIGIWMFNFDTTFFENRNEYQNQIQHASNNTIPRIQTASTTSDRSNWKTYSDATYSFEFMYPPHLTAVSGSHFGGGIPNPGEVQFTLTDPKGDLLDEVTPLIIVVFSVEPTTLKNNDEYLNLVQTYINSNEYIKNTWKVAQKDFFNMGPAVFTFDDSGTLSLGVHIVNNASLFTFTDYSSYADGSVAKEVMNTFHFVR